MNATILVVDTDLKVRTDLGQIFQATGYPVVVAANLAEMVAMVFRRDGSDQAYLLVLGQRHFGIDLDVGMTNLKNVIANLKRVIGVVVMPTFLVSQGAKPGHACMLSTVAKLLSVANSLVYDYFECFNHGTADTLPSEPNLFLLSERRLSQTQ